MSEIISSQNKYNRLHSPDEVAEVVYRFERAKAFQELSHFTPKEWDYIGDQAEITAYRLENAPPPHLKQPQNLEPGDAKALFGDLHQWNRPVHNKIIEKFEGPFLRLAERIIDRSLLQPEFLKTISQSLKIDEVPYSVSSLPPNLFTIDNSDEAYLPKNYYDAAYIAHTAGLHVSRLQMHFGEWPFGAKHDDISYLETASQVAFELRRRIVENDQTFFSEKGLRDWKKYRKLFATHLEEGNLSLIENAAFVSYQKNRTATAAGGFFEHVTEEFDSFLLTSMMTGSVFTSQLRVPVGAYGKDFSLKLIRAAAVMSYLIQQDGAFGAEILTEMDEESENLLKSHFMRTHNADRYDLKQGLYNTGIEATSSVTALFSLLMAEGVPGREDDSDAALVDIFESNLPRKVTALMPQAVVVPSTLYGRHFKEMLLGKGSDLTVNPEVVDSIMQMHDNRTAIFHELWKAYNADATLPKPVRLGLRCPFKGEVTGKFAEALVVIYGMLNKIDDATT